MRLPRRFRVPDAGAGVCGPRAADIFSQLSAGGNVLMPFEQTFFARKFGMVADKFGVKWMVNVAAPAASS